MAIGDALSGADRDAFEAMRAFFADAGFSQQDVGSLSAAVQEYLQQGYSPETISLLLKETDPYRRRFGVVNDQRQERGLPVLQPGEIIGLERQYKNRFRAYGIPEGLFDQNEDLIGYLAADVSPEELEDRLNIARASVVSDDPFVRETYQAWYGQGLSEGDAIAAVLDPDRALPAIERKARAAALGAASDRQGIGVSQSRAEELAALGADPSNALEQFGTVAAINRTASRLASRYDLDYEGQTDAADAVFFNDAEASERIRRLGQREEAEFGGRGLGDSRSLGRGSY